jgi:hypothetical protein
MARQVFDQAQHSNSKAQRFAAAFEGCDEWTIPPRKRRHIEEETVFDVKAIRFRDDHTDLRRAA